jgi:murein L,D-transpeptidase YcbB/YkuD
VSSTGAFFAWEGKNMKNKIGFFFVITGCFFSISNTFLSSAVDPRVQKVYDSLHNELIWIKDGAWSSCGKTLLETLAHVEEEGLWLENYVPIVNKLQKMDIASPEAQKEADALLTLAALNYISDMSGERLNPRAVAKNIFIKAPVVSEEDLLKTYLSLPDQCGWIHALSPSTPEYLHLKQLLASYRQKKAQGGWPQLPKNTKLQKGDKGPLVETLKTQLSAQDALPPEGHNGNVFDEVLESFLKAYQDTHGLEQDGKVGEATLKALNTSVEDRIRSIIVSLERQRWFASPMPPRYIQVNVPGFYLKAVGEDTSFFMPIITGREYRQTPIFNAIMDEVTFNPSWHVPTSIAVRDKLPKLMHNPNALAGKGYHFYDASGREVSPSSINWRGYAGGRLPVRIVQSPGNANALGKIRFTIKSPFDIYLHGTPDQKLFQKAHRALSSGCIRVADPVKLAEFVFHDLQKWSLDRIRKESSGTKTKKTKLDAPLPVFVTYFTVFEDENHKWHFVEDGYHQDSKAWAALERTRKKVLGKKE